MHHMTAERVAFEAIFNRSGNGVVKNVVVLWLKVKVTAMGYAVSNGEFMSKVGCGAWREGQQ